MRATLKPNLRRTTPATSPAIATAEAKDHARVTHDAEDDYFKKVLIPAAVEAVETVTGYRMMTQTWRASFQAFPSSDATALELPGAPFASVTTFTYTDTAGTLQTMVAGTDYTLDDEHRPALLYPAYGTSWPTARPIPNAVKVDYVLGVTDAKNIDPQHKLAALELVSHWYENRTPVEVGQGLTALSVPETFWRLTSGVRLF